MPYPSNPSSKRPQVSNQSYVIGSHMLDRKRVKKLFENFTPTWQLVMESRDLAKTIMLCIAAKHAEGETFVDKFKDVEDNS